MAEIHHAFAGRGQIFFGYLVKSPAPLHHQPRPGATWRDVWRHCRSCNRRPLPFHRMVLGSPALNSLSIFPRVVSPSAEAAVPSLAMVFQWLFSEVRWSNSCKTQYFNGKSQSRWKRHSGKWSSQHWKWSGPYIKWTGQYSKWTGQCFNWNRHNPNWSWQYQVGPGHIQNGAASIRNWSEHFSKWTRHSRMWSGYFTPDP